MEDNIRDRWLIDGDCSCCRRAPHCSKPCKKHTERQQAIMARAFGKLMIKTLLEHSE